MALRKLLDFRKRCSLLLVLVCLFSSVLVANAETISCPAKCLCTDTRVSCRGQQLVEVPHNLPSWVEILDLNGNALTTVDPAAFERLRNLQQLDLGSNRIDKLPEGLFQTLLNLTDLNLDNNRLTELPHLGVLPNLTSLTLSHNKISSLNGTWLFHAKSLRVLDLSLNKISDFPAGVFSNGSRLQYFNLSSNRLLHLEKGCFYNLTALIDLRLSRNRISSLPKELFKRLSALKSLELNRNRLSKIEGLTFDGLTSLTTLRLRRNEIAQLLDGAFWGLTAIQQLQLDYNNISLVTKGWLYGLSSLQQLSLSHNHISVIEEDAWEFCQQLWELDLTYNELQIVSKTTFAHLPKVQRLLLDHNRISYIEEASFATLPALLSLEINHNEISWTIEDTNGAFSGLSHVTKIGLAANKIKSVARKAFAGLEGLRVLDLDDNAIATIQENAFAELSSLQELRLKSSSMLCDCQLGWFPGWLQQFKFESSGLVEAKCGHPSSLVGKDVSAVAVENFTCDDFPKPHITEEPKTMIALKGDNVTLTCKAESTAPTPMTFLWKKDNLIFKGNHQVTYAKSLTDSRSVQMASQLQLTNISDTDSGKYQCIVSNDFGSTYSTKVKITVHVFPTFTKTPSDVRVKAGNTARLECHAEGSPSPEVAWKKDGGDDFPAARERRMQVMPTDDVFFIVNVKTADMGVYSCTAENEAGVVVANATLTVLETPSFVKPMEDKKTVAGETTVLECMASGSPKPRLTWTKDGGSLDVTERHFFTADNQLLIIVKTRPADAGRYECEMSNPLGTERGSSLVTVLPGHSSSVLGLDDDSTTTGIIIIAVVCCVVGTSLIWVIIIHQTRKRASPTSSSSTAASHSPGGPTLFPAVELIPAEVDDSDLIHEVEMENLPETSAYPPSLPVLRYNSGSTRQLYTYLPDNHSDSEQSSKDSGTGDSAKRSHSNEDVNDIVVDQADQSLHSFIPPERPAPPPRSMGLLRNNSSARTLSTFVPTPRVSHHDETSFSRPRSFRNSQAYVNPHSTRSDV